MTKDNSPVSGFLLSSLRNQATPGPSSSLPWRVKQAAREDCAACGTKFERGDDGVCNRCGMDFDTGKPVPSKQANDEQQVAGPVQFATFEQLRLPPPTRVTAPQAAPQRPQLPQLGIPVIPAPQVKMRRTDDADALRTAVYDSVLNAASTMEPVVGPTHTLQVSNVHYAKDDPEYTRSDEKKAILSRASLARRLRGTWQLMDNETGKVVSERQATLANVPAILKDGSILNRGTRYMMGYQQRLRPGVYVRNRKNGESESHVNTRPGHGRSHRYVLNPESGQFTINIEHAKIPLVPLLETLGATREEISEAWGPELAAENFKKTDPKAIGKLYERLVPKKLQEAEDRNDPAKMKGKIREAFDDMLVDGEVTGRTVGQASDKVDASMILKATAKTLKLANNQEEADDRDHLAYATFHSAPDVFAERFQKDYGRLRRDLLWKAARKGTVDSIPSSVLDKQVEAAIFKSGLANTTEETNPLALLAEMTRVTRYGEGGLPSTTATPDESRNVNPGQFGFIDLIATPESTKVGVDGYLARNTYIGDDNKLYTDVIDAKTGERVRKSASDLLDATFEFQGSPVPGRSLAIRKGKMALIKKGSGEYKLPDFEELFGHSSNIVPMKSAMFGQRTSMAQRMSGQAMSLENAEAPLVQSGVPGEDGVSFEDKLGERMGAIRSPDRGRVLEVTPDFVKVKYSGGEVKTFDLDNNRPGARKSVFHHSPLVQVGQEVEPGQMIAKSNYTDDNGTTALGTNVRAALMSLEDNWEDGTVISQGLADRMRVQQSYRHGIESGDGTEINKSKFLSIFGNNFKADQLASLDKNGAVKVGTVVKKGDPLVLGLRERDGVTSRVHRQGKKNFADATVKWEHNHDGIVTDVMETNKGTQVVVRTSKGLEVGDKLSGRAGNKGVVAIWPDSKMPVDSEGNPIEMAISPQAVPSRGNSSFPIELVLGKIAKKRGQPYKVVDGQEIASLADFAAEEAKKHGVEQTETLTDPRTGRKIPGVLTGQMFNMALSHIAESKQSSRGIGKYTAEGAPARGASEGSKAKRFSGQQLYAHLSHGAYDYSREGSLLRGKRNDDYWSAFMSGNQIGEPRIPEQYEGMIARLKGAGINPVRTGSRTQLMAMTDKDTEKLTGGRTVTVADTFNTNKRRDPIKGGLFDPELFGDGSKFASIELAEPMPNPVFEEPIRRLLGLTEKEFRNTLAGKDELPGYGSGPEALGKRLENMNVDVEIDRAREEIKGTKKTARDAAVRRLGYLKGLKKAGTQPKDLMVSKIPVIPPRLRPITEMQGKGGLMINDANFLYKELMQAGENLQGLKGKVSDLSEERLTTYDAYKALVGLSEPKNQELKQRKVKGLLKTILGKNSPKTGLMQRKLLSGNVDTVGRSVIMVDSNLDMDSVGLPESMAFEIFQPYIVRHMVSRGVPKLQAMEYAKEKHERAREALLDVMKERPVTVSRAPILHKYGDVGQWAHLVKGDAVRVNPVMLPPAGGDLDGDTVNVNVPHGTRAMSEVIERMMPSKMLHGIDDFKTAVFRPTQDMLLGLYEASRGVDPKNKKRERYFESKAAAIAAFRRGEIDIDTPVRFPGK